ncbi:MAG: hypothetical protein N4A71_11625 [Carboxylicivirga sp.]|jgi:uncharacterized membrane protein|nr:hypothetical protein [Carboxylicivirga sp.]
MKPIIISPQHIRRELIVALISFVIANVLNIYAIIHYQTEWKELFTYLPVVIILTGIIYFLILLIRGLILGIRKIVKLVRVTNLS